MCAIRAAGAEHVEPDEDGDGKGEVLPAGQGCVTSEKRHQEGRRVMEMEEARHDAPPPR